MPNIFKPFKYYVVETLNYKHSDMSFSARHRLLNLVFLCLLTVFHQQVSAVVTVRGRVASATDDTPLSGATLRMLLLPDSTLLVGNYSDKDGNFVLASSRVKTSAKNPAKILIAATYMGYQPVEKLITVRPRTNEYDLKDVYLQEEAHLLGEALVSATPPPVVVREDTIEYFASSYKTQPDATAEDLLKRLPGVEVNVDGSITAQGEAVQQVYVDGKEFFGRNTQMTTRNITAEMIETVQVVDMQTEEARLTGIDDGERRKVINFKLKPKMRRGWFGNGAGAWGMGHDIDNRFDARGMIGYFRGNSQNALAVNANNTNNAAFGDLGDNLMGGTSMRGNRQSGQAGDGLNTSWSVGLNIGYDEGNRMRDPNTPLAINGNLMYGGSEQDEMSKSHRINYLKTGNTLSDNQNIGHNNRQNIQTGIKYEKSWGNLADGQHRLQINPDFSYNQTRTNDYSESHTGHELLDANGNGTDQIGTYISQTQRNNEINQSGMNVSLGMTYSFTKRTDLGRRRTSITLNFSERLSKGDQYTRSFTTYDEALLEFDRYAGVTSNVLLTPRDTLINQWQEEDSHNETYRLRITHVEPIAERQTLEFSAQGSLSNRSGSQIYHFWDDAAQEWSDVTGTRTSRDLSSETEVQNVNYTLSASYRKVSDMYNFSVGMDFLPQTQKYTDFYDHTRDYKRHYINYSPKAEYRYNWTRKKYLRITLNGQTQQPSMNQLQARKNQTSATHVSLGNKDLDPSFSTNFTARYRSFNEDTYSTVEFGLSANANFNSLATKRWYSEDLRTDTTMTINLNGLGNWNTQADFRGSWPFYDNLWYVTNTSTLGYRESQGYASIKSTDAQLNHTRNYTGSETAGIAYRGEKLNVELRGNYHLQYAEATIVTSGNLGATHRFGFSNNIQATIFWDMILSSDFNYTARRGFNAALTRNQSIWNMQLSRAFKQPKYTITSFVKVFDILRQKSAISRNVTDTSLTDRETTVLSQYFLIGASLRFNRMGARGGRGGGRPGNGEGRRDGGRESF